MTFILNILHKDFSLLAADRKGNSQGPVTATVGKITIVMPSGAVIEGMKKILLPRNHKFAVAFAGSTSDHGYLDSLTELETFEDAATRIRSHMEAHYQFQGRDKEVGYSGLSLRQCWQWNAGW